VDVTVAVQADIDSGGDGPFPGSVDPGGAGPFPGSVDPGGAGPFPGSVDPGGAGPFPGLVDPPSGSDDGLFTCTVGVGVAVTVGVAVEVGGKVSDAVAPTNSDHAPGGPLAATARTV
jgi:hypothetical protein